MAKAAWMAKTLLYAAMPLLPRRPNGFSIAKRFFPIFDWLFPKGLFPFCKNGFSGLEGSLGSLLTKAY